MITVAQTLLLLVDTGACVVFLWAYAAGNRWWTSRVGRALVGLGTCIGLIIGYASLKRLFGWPTIPWVGVAIDVSVAVVLVYLATMFVRERQVWRGRGQRTRHDRATSTKERGLTMAPRPGDFGLVAISGAVGRLIRFGQWLNGNGWGGYQHAVLVLDNGELIEAEPGGARIRPVSEYDGTNVVWSDWPLTDAERVAIVAAGRALVGTPYSALDYGALFAHRLHLPVRGLRCYIGSTGHMICSQLVDEVYRRAGLAMFDDGRWSGYVTPMALVRALHGPVTA